MNIRYFLLKSPGILVKPSNGAINSYYLVEDNFKIKYPEQYEVIMELDYPEDYTFRDRMYLIYHKRDFNKCLVCGIAIKTFRKTRGIEQEYCSRKCLANSTKVIEKKKKTCQKLYGGIAPASSEVVRDKMKATTLERHGVEHALHSNVIKERIKKTCLERYGVENPSSFGEFVIKRKQTMLKRYGGETSTQCPELLEKIQMSGFRRKEYVMPSGDIRSIQGYENRALDILLENYQEQDIITDMKEVPMFWYIFEDKKSRYFPDIYIPSTNFIIEVKSKYIYKRYLERNLAKEKAVLSEGYNFKFMIFNKKGPQEILRPKLSLSS